ncbi:hypothetical protein [Bacteriovorax sp. Seq25_V]|uniref:hypothetical protein n=1 Tax=Bacteriovorax sp. Seq25_V TaxID=1201288 RepID=UPI00038A2AD1|nr:hypothetical protein [Bacteriovorax sp. Seq25_V]EQC46180.1 hypothetical protein M900_1772 [Bacteriovorax sp. Seq25_V]
MDTEKNFELLQRICQIKKLRGLNLFLMLIVAYSCSRNVVLTDTKDTEAEWFNTDRNFSSVDYEGRTTIHQFFDPPVDFDINKNLVDVVVTTPANSPYHYELDMVSGQKVFNHAYCKESNVWTKEKNAIEYPPYHDAFIPKLLNQSKLPQRVIFFGADKAIAEQNPKHFSNIVKVRIISGVVEQYCKTYPCDTFSKWDSNILLIGVSQADPKYAEVRSFKDLVQVIDWPKSKAFLENGRGRILGEDNSFPAYKIYGQVLPTNALKFAVEKGHLFSTKELRTLRRSCESIYSELEESRKKMLNLEVDFPTYFLEFYRTKKDLFYACQEFVKGYEITADLNAHWYYEYLRAFFFLNKDNLVYDCAKREWMRNYRGPEGKLVYNQEKELAYCSSAQLNVAFEKAVTYLSTYRSKGSEFYEYIEYDSGSYGTAEKIYNWVKRTGKVQTCNKVVIDRPIFPEDIRWNYITGVKEESAEKVQVFKRKK